MTDFKDSDTAKTARDQAAHWFARARLGTLTSQEQRECEAWRAASPENDRQYRSLETLWRVADDLPRERMRAVLAQTEAVRPAVNRRRGFVMGLGAACTLALVAGVVATKWWDVSPEYTAQFASAKGERQQFTLPDGSILDLNTATQATVSFYDNRRVVELSAGEALFSVSPDAARPFTVDAGRAEVLVTGTRFNVRRDEDAVTVAVDEGVVEFSAGPWWKRNTARLTAGYVSRASANEALVTPYRHNVAALMAWQRGRLVFQDTTLSRVVAELNRYLAHPLRINDAQVARIRVSGTVGIESPESVLDVLPQIAPVSVLRLEDGTAVLVASR